ncbi:MAG: hypothetical protein KatS3mg124_0552 [Porticoccaceae bacterium]|nr:MAG: hypothetical protein KatS3mg124_0552 [Porticoccaceae bacterium]
MDRDERELFRTAVGPVEPLRKAGARPQEGSRREDPGLHHRRLAAAGEAATADRNPLDPPERVVPVGPWDELSFRKSGVQHGVFRNLRLGRYPIQSRLDLHGLTGEEARIAVFAFVRDCLAQDVRLALISHGRGEGRKPPAFLKSCVNHWLRQLDEVLAFHSAQRHHGGYGATYVLLRKSAAKREENRERFARRGG